MSKLSVIIPVYNKEIFLDKCLNSLLKQTFTDFEIICVNDGSTDSSLKILQEYADRDSRIKIISQKNKGRSGARNTGIKNAGGEWITFIDPDDYIDAETYETVFKNTLNDLELICFGIKTFGKSTKELAKSDKKYYKIKYEGKIPAEDEVLYNTDCSVCNKLFLRSIIKKYKIDFPQGRNYEDACFYFKYVSVIKSILFIPKNFYHYLRHDDSIMAETFHKTDKALDHLYIVEDIFNFYKKNDLLKIKKDLFLKLFTSYFYFATRWAQNEQKALTLAKNLIIQLKLEQYYPNNEFLQRILGNKNNNLIQKQTLSCKLFCFLPIYERKQRGGKVQYKLFGVPVWKIRRMANNITTKYYFCGIPLLKVSKK